MIARVGRKEKERDRDRGRKKSGFRFNYRKRSVDDVKRRAEQRGGSFDSPVKRGVDMWRPKSGENVIRILPATWDGYDHYGLDVFMHRYVGSDNSNYICPNKMKGKKCCICDEAKELKADGEDEEAKQIAFQKRVWFYVIDRDDKTATPQIWDASWSQDRDISQLSTYSNGKVLLIDHPDEGFDVIVKKTGSGKKGTKYSFNIERDSSPIDDDQDKQDEILKFITENPIPDMFQIYSNEHLAKKMEGGSASKDEDLDDEDEDEGRGKKRRRSRDEDEDDDRKGRRGKRSRDEEDEEIDDPPRRRRKPAKDEDEDEEEDRPRRRSRRDADEDDEDDDKPRRGKKKARDEEEDEDEEDERSRKKKSRSRDEDEEDEEDEDERPRKKKKKARDEEEEEDEEDEEDEDEDEEEDERPRRRRK